MARERMVTRTIKETTVSVMYVNVNDAKVDYCDYIISGDYDNNEAIMKYLKKMYENDNIKLINIINVDSVDKLYGMPEAEFMRLARELPARV